MQPNPVSSSKETEYFQLVVYIVFLFSILGGFDFPIACNLKHFAARVLANVVSCICFTLEFICINQCVFGSHQLFLIIILVCFKKN